jgi:hypothetical protein
VDITNIQFHKNQNNFFGFEYFGDDLKKKSILNTNRDSGKDKDYFKEDSRIGRRVEKERRVGVSNDSSMRKVSEPSEIYGYDQMVSTMKIEHKRRAFGQKEGLCLLSGDSRFNSIQQYSSQNASIQPSFPVVKILTQHKSQDFNLNSSNRFPGIKINQTPLNRHKHTFSTSGSNITLLQTTNPRTSTDTHPKFNILQSNCLKKGIKSNSIINLNKYHFSSIDDT